jgi:tetratricopeptide (TPR) repeat protein
LKFKNAGRVSVVLTRRDRRQRTAACNVEAEAALRAATRVDPTFADAWYNLSDLLDEQGRVDAAIACLPAALRVAPDYTDAMFNLALLLQRQSQYAQ